VEVLAFLSELTHQVAQCLDAPFGGTDRNAFLAAGIRARLSRVQPVLNRTGKEAVRDVPDIGFVVGVGDLVAKIDRFAERLAERIYFLHGSLPQS
jgi:hypothetical protein